MYGDGLGGRFQLETAIAELPDELWRNALSERFDIVADFESGDVKGILGKPIFGLVFEVKEEKKRALLATMSKQGLVLEAFDTYQRRHEAPLREFFGWALRWIPSDDENEGGPNMVAVAPMQRLGLTQEDTSDSRRFGCPVIVRTTRNMADHNVVTKERILQDKDLLTR